MKPHVIDALRQVDAWTDDQLITAAASAMLTTTAPETLQIIVTRGESEFVKLSAGMHIASRALEASLRGRVFQVIRKTAIDRGLIHG